MEHFSVSNWRETKEGLPLTNPNSNTDTSSEANDNRSRNKANDITEFGDRH